MNILDFFRFNPLIRSFSAKNAKERLQIVVSHQRGTADNPAFLPELRRELLEVIAKHTKSKQEDIAVQLFQQGNHSILELNITLPATQIISP